MLFFVVAYQQPRITCLFNSFVQKAKLLLGVCVGGLKLCPMGGEVLPPIVVIHGIVWLCDLKPK